MKIVILGLSITSSWGNGHATNYRALVAEMGRRGHEVTFCERDVPWYRDHRDEPAPAGAELILYSSLGELAAHAAERVRKADLVILGSYVPEGVAVAEWMLSTTQGVTAFYDIDTPVTLAKLEAGDEEYLALRLLERFDLYLSFSGGPTLERLADLGVQRPRAFYCLVDPDRYEPVVIEPRWELGYLGTWSADRQPSVDELLLATARALPERAFALAGPQYPDSIRWPDNVERVEHLPPSGHPGFYCAQRFTLNVTRAAMRRAGYSPSVRLFEAAATGTPIISDPWPGLEEIFLPGEEILVAETTQEMVELLRGTDEAARRDLAARARRRVLEAHTPRHRIDFLETEVGQLSGARSDGVLR